jgi:regulator of protease activity HflC (stomatin/prohibitin superfamily)
MLEPLFNFLAQIRDKIIPCTIISVYERGAVLRLGHYHRTVEPGLRWHWPLIEKLTAEITAIATLRLQPQTCTTKDRKSIVVAGVVKYQLVDVQAYVCKVFDAQDVLFDISMGAILKEIRLLTYDQLVDQPPEAKIASAIRRQVKEFGFEIISMTFIDIGEIRSLRLIQHTQQHNEHLL